MTSKRVAVIGAGPAGLVASKSLIEVGIHPVIFDRSDRVGGMWDPATGRAWKSLRTNLSKHTCRFSDHPWPPGTPMFPRHEQMRQYLSSYAERFLSQSESCTFQWNSTILHVRPNQQENDLNKQSSFHVQWRDEHNQISHSEEFDAVFICSGLMSRPFIPKVEGLQAPSECFPGVVIHGSEYTDAETFQNKNVLVVGASYSAIEISAEVASSARSVKNILPTVPWVVPRVLPLDPKNPASPFLPLDLVFYRDRAGETDSKDVVKMKKYREVLLKTPEELHNTHEYIKNLFGTNSAASYSGGGYDALAQQRSALEPGDGQPRRQNVAISEDYNTLVKIGRIQPIIGRLTAFKKNQFHVKHSAVVDTDGIDSLNIPAADVDAVIFCTGYHPDVSYLDTNILQTLKYDEKETFMPFILYRELMHPKYSGLYFIGMYKAPYFGTMELQARLAAAYLSAKVPMPSTEELQEGLQLSMRVRHQPHPRPQFPHTDYIGMMYDLAMDLQQQPKADTKLKGATVVTPIDFLSEERNGLFVVQEREVMDRSISNYISGRRGVANVVFRSIVGRWQFTRIINDAKSKMPSQVDGMINFSPLVGKPVDKMLLYSEEGKLKLPNMPNQFDVSQKYIYTCRTASEEDEREADELVLYFCKKSEKDDSPEVDYHFLTLSDFTAAAEEEVSGGGGWIARAYHPCGEDHYNAKYRFCFAGLSLKEIEIEFIVKGPNKDYISTTILRRTL